MMDTAEVAEQTTTVADEVTSALGHLAETAVAAGDLESGSAGAGAPSATDTLITTVATSMINKVDGKTSISCLLYTSPSPRDRG